MAKYFFETWIEPIKLKEMMAFELGPCYRLSVKRNRVGIIQDATRACEIKVKKKDDKMICSGPYGYIPSDWLRVVWFCAIIVVLTILKQIIGYYVLATIPIVCFSFLLLRKALSQKLVSKVSQIMQSLPKNQRK